jgi:hypothetical protein
MALFLAELFRRCTRNQVTDKRWKARKELYPLMVISQGEKGQRGGLLQVHFRFCASSFIDVQDLKVPVDAKGSTCDFAVCTKTQNKQRQKGILNLLEEGIIDSDNHLPSEETAHGDRTWKYKPATSALHEGERGFKMEITAISVIVTAERQQTSTASMCHYIQHSLLLLVVLVLFHRVQSGNSDRFAASKPLHLGCYLPAPSRT